MNAFSFSPFADAIRLQKYAMTKPDGSKETWAETCQRVIEAVFSVVPDSKELARKAYAAMFSRKFLPGGRYLYAAGRPLHQVNNCFLMRAEDSREGWAKLIHNSMAALMTGGGVGVDYSAIRPSGALIKRTGGEATGPIALMQILNEAGRHIRQGGARRSALWAGLNWRHADIIEYIRVKDWSPETRKQKEKDFDCYAPLDGTNVSVILDSPFFKAYEGVNNHATQVYWDALERMVSTGEPGFSVDYNNPLESLRNPCCEVVSEDDSDVCCLGSLNLARIESIDELRELTEVAVAFLLAGTVYSDLPYEKVEVTRTKNRRLGLGVMGVHEWLLQRGKRYEPDADLKQWLDAWAMQSRSSADQYAQAWNLSRPKAVRAIAPTGTIGIIAETTTGIEPIFCVAYRRRYKAPGGTGTVYQYVVDPTAKRLIDNGVNPDDIEDAYSLAADVERRVAFQAFMQSFVDQAISSTINLPAWGSEHNNENTVKPFGEMLLKYLPKLRGITVYPDGARGGQPLVPVKYSTAVAHVGQVFEEAADICAVSSGGSCGA